LRLLTAGTLPGRRSNGNGTAIHVNFRTCDVGRLIESQKQNGIGHFLNFSGPAHRNDPHAFCPHGRIGGAAGCAHRRHDAGMNRVSADPVLRMLPATDLVIRRTAAFEALYAM